MNNAWYPDSCPSPKSRLFHFDVKTFANYGDTLLFELVRHLFNGYQHKQKFIVTDSSNLRRGLGPIRLKGINDHYDAIIVGGGGLFLRDTNPNDNSGWQWNCSLKMLGQIVKPLIIFAVGYNRFIGQDDFEPIFTKHVNLTAEKAIFFGLRNSGSIEAIKKYLRPELHHKVVYQPCATTIASYLLPDIYKPNLSREKRIGFNIAFGKRQVAGGFDKQTLYEGLKQVVIDLKRKGWEVEIIAHVKGDIDFHTYLSDSGITTRCVELHSITRGVFDGVQYYSSLPITIVMRK